MLVIVIINNIVIRLEKLFSPNHQSIQSELLETLVVEHPTRSRRVVGSNPIWNSEFFFPSFSVNAKFIMLYSSERLTWRLDIFVIQLKYL